MGYPRIVFDGNTFNFPRPPALWTPLHQTVTTRVEASGGIVTMLHRHRKFVFKTGFSMLTEEQERDLMNFWFWASAGNEFAIARDSDEMVSTTYLAASSSTAFSVASTTGVTAGDLLLLGNTTRTTWEIVKIDTVASATLLTVTEAMLNASSWAAGDPVRHLNYLPYARLRDPEDFVIATDGEGETNTYSLSLTVEESIQE
jgi:hypothetical protein